MTAKTFFIPGDGTRARLMLTKQVGPQIIAMADAGHSQVLKVSEVSKTRDQEVKYHAMIGDIAEQAQHLGSKWDSSDWKRLLLDKFARETHKATGRIIPNLDSNGVVEVGILSRNFGKREANEFIEWLYSWGAENGCYFGEKFVDPETGEVIKTTWQDAARRANEEVAA